MRIKSKIKRNSSANIYFLLLFPFFEPGFINSFSDGIFVTLGHVFAAYRYFSAFAGIAIFIAKRKKNRIKRTPLFYVLLINTLICTLSNIINGVNISAILSTIYEIGFILILEALISKGIKCFLNVVVRLFGFLSIAGALLIIAFPNGFNHAQDKFYAIYFLGSKNASINIYIIFLIALCGIGYNQSNKITPRVLAVLLLFALTGVIMQSGSTIAVLAIMIAYYAVVILSFGKLYIKPWIPFLIVTVSVIIIYISQNVPYVVKIVTLLGKDTTFHGRVTLWHQAIEYFRKSPLLGVGVEAEFYNLGGTVQVSAHSQYLDRLAKYGILSMSCFIGIIIYIEAKLNNSRDKALAGLLGLAFSVYLLKMGVDTYDFKLFIITCYEIIVFLEAAKGHTKQNN